MIKQKHSIIIATLLSISCIHAMQKTIEEKNIFDNRTWDGKQKAFTHYRNTTDGIVRPINGAGVLPVIYRPEDSKLYFLLSVAVVENGTDENIGKDPVYVNPSNYPVAPTCEESYESSIDMAARPEELGVIAPFLDFRTIKYAIEKDGELLPNAGMCYGRYAVPTYITLLGRFEHINALLKEVEQKIEQQDYDRLFPTSSAIKRTDKIKKFELVPAFAVLKAIKEQGANRVEKPLAIEGCAYKLSPYVARTIALNNNPRVIEKALQEYAAYVF
jgi:hypothetical protein